MGQLIAGKYCLLHELARGGMGSVWAAEHIALRSKVALKLIEPQILSDPLAQARFEREAQALAALRSPNVVQVLDYGVDGGIQYLVMELLQGRTLRGELLARGRLHPDEVWTIVEQVTRALTVSHAAGFVHRDLKPENLFLVDDEAGFAVKVLDFGITKSLSPETLPLTSTGGVLGTCEYMSPEQALGEGVDSRSDLWTLAVVTFEALLGFSPFKAKSAVVTLTSICNGPTVVPSELGRVPAGFDAWFARATERDPGQRFQTARQLAAELQPVLDVPRSSLEEEPPAMLSEEDRTIRVHVSAGPPFERRSSSRFPSSIPAAIDGQRNLRNTGLIYNASETGALLATRRGWESGQTLTLTLYLDDAYRGETLRAQVVRVSECDDQLWKYTVAVRFAEALSSEFLARIEAKAKARA